jgi:hypothetical protein
MGEETQRQYNSSRKFTRLLKKRSQSEAWGRLLIYGTASHSWRATGGGWAGRMDATAASEPVSLLPAAIDCWCIARQAMFAGSQPGAAVESSLSNCAERLTVRREWWVVRWAQPGAFATHAGSPERAGHLQVGQPASHRPRVKTRGLSAPSQTPAM